jgi:hypothetical protein
MKQLNNKMMKKIFILINLSLVQWAFAQIQDYNFQRELETASQEWHSVYLPETLFSKAKLNLSDLRIYQNDTLEVPYLLEVMHDEKNTKKVPFKLVNQVSKNAKRYYTFKMDEPKIINEIHLDFNKSNFDFKVQFQGSNNNRKWFDIKKTRLLGISNGNMSYNYSKIYFSNAEYAYYRIIIPTKKVKLSQAYLYNKVVIKGEKMQYQASIATTTKDKKTIINIKLKNSVPVSEISLNVASDFDYYRSINIKYLSDSIKTPKGWIKNYQNLYNGTLSSLEKADFDFLSHISNEFKIIINNQDNQSLAIGSVKISGKKHRLIAHFNDYKNKNNTYKLAYGNKKIRKPHYDISFFSNKIPKTLQTLKLGKEIKIDKASYEVENSFLSSEKLLWVLLIIIILFIGKFTLKMLKKPNHLDNIK